MTQTIHTKLHEAMTAFAPPAGVVRKSLKEDAQTSSEVQIVLEEFAKLPHIVLSEDLLDKLDPDALLKSVNALHQAGVLALPYPRLSLELWSGIADSRMFLVVEQQPEQHFRVQAVRWKLRQHELGGPVHAFGYPYEIDTQWGDTMANTGKPREDFGFITKVRTRSSSEEEVSDTCALIGRALVVALAMTFISGLQREIVDPGKLNKHRTHAGKPSIPTHTIVHIGHVYDSSGRKVTLHNGNRRSMPIHMRAAHVRRQHHGPEWLALHPEEAAKPTTTADQHLVLIEAVLVNYRDGTDLAKPLPKVIRA